MGPSWRRLGAVLGPSWTVLGPSWTVLRETVAKDRLPQLAPPLFERFLERLGPSWAPPGGPFWGHFSLLFRSIFRHRFGSILGMNLEQFWVASGGHFGVIFGAFFDFNFKTISGPVFVRFWSRFGAQVGEQKQPKPLEGCSKSRFSASRV